MSGDKTITDSEALPERSEAESKVARDNARRVLRESGVAEISADAE